MAVTDMMERVARRAANRAVLRYGLPDHYRDDLVNVALLAQWLAAPKRGSPTGTDGGYAKVVAARAARDFARWVRRRVARETPYVGRGQEPWRLDPEPAELPPAVRAAIARLPRVRRELFTARYLADEGVAAICRRTGRCPPTVRTEIKRALAAVRVAAGADRPAELVG